MGSLYVLMTVVATLTFAVVQGWPYDDEFQAWRLARTSRRSHHCISSGSKCFSTDQCCRGFVCAAFDYFGSGRRTRSGTDPETPGFCVKEKDLQSCYSHRECDPGVKCISLGRDGESYCIQGPASSFMEEEPAAPQQPASASRVRGHSMKAGGNGLGGSCSGNSDCLAFDKNGAQLCCQQVSRGRQGSVMMCDRVTPISKCIAD